MTPTPEITTHESEDELAEAVAARLVLRLVEIQGTGRVPSVVLTGGSIADRIHRAVAAFSASPSASAQGAVGWSQVDFWFGDERFVPADHEDRNAGQAARAMLDRLPVDPERVHEMPASDGEYGDDLGAAADAYAQEVRTHGSGEFDVVMLGVGPDGHVASLFPGLPHLGVEDTVAVAVRDSPKPPPERVSLTFPALERAREVWFVVAGADKAGAVRRALDPGADVHEIPASRPKGRDRTLWFLDEQAAQEL